MTIAPSMDQSMVQCHQPIVARSTDCCTIDRSIDGATLSVDGTNPLIARDNNININNNSNNSSNTSNENDRLPKMVSVLWTRRPMVRHKSVWTDSLGTPPGYNAAHSERVPDPSATDVSKLCLQPSYRHPPIAGARVAWARCWTEAIYCRAIRSVVTASFLVIAALRVFCCIPLWLLHLALQMFFPHPYQVWLLLRHGHTLFYRAFSLLTNHCKPYKAHRNALLYQFYHNSTEHRITNYNEGAPCCHFSFWKWPMIILEKPRKSGITASQFFDILSLTTNEWLNE